MIIKRGFKKLFAAGLAALMAVSLAACGGDDKSDEDEDKAAAGDSFVYVPEYISLGEENMRTSSMVCSDGKLYLNAYIYDEENGISRQPMYQYDIATGSMEELELGNAEALEDAYVQEMAVDSDGNLYILWVRSVWDENNPENWHQDTMLAKYDTSGAKVFLQDISQEMTADEMNTYIQEMAVDGDGRIYLSSDSIIRLFDGEGAYRGNVETGNYWINDMIRGKDGKVYIAYNDWNTGNGYVAVEIDFAGKKLGSTHAIQSDVNKLSEGLEKDFLISDRVRLYEYDVESDTQEELLNWVECDINGDYVQLVCPAGDGRLLAVVSDWETGNTELAFLTKTKASDVVQKEELVLGTLQMSQDLRSTVVAFNKSNEKYHITIKEYYSSYDDMDYSTAITNLNNELVSGSGLDLLAMDSNVDVGLLAEKGILADLNPFLNGSSILSRDSFVESVLRSYTYGDILVSIPKSFSLNAVAGKTSQVGEGMGWSIQDFIDLAAKNPGAELFEYASQSMMMQVLMTFNQDAFIDWEKGTCNFDTEEFRQMLEFAASFSEEFNWDGEQESTPVKLATGKLLLRSDSISGYYDIQVTEAMFNEPVTYIGFPTTDGSVGCVLEGNGGYCIIDKSRNKDGAWEFIEFYLNRDSGMFTWGFPSRKAALEEEIAEACKADYATDVNGEIMKDEEGNPIIISHHSYSYGNDWSYESHPCTEEEIATLWELIDVARPMPTANSEVLAIIAEEAEAFYKGQKSLDDVVSTIQSRVSMYVGENS